MRLVRLALVPLILLAFASVVFAQTEAKSTTSAPAATKSTTAKTPEEMAKEALAKWKTTLKITDEQAPQFESIMTDSYKQMADAKTAAAGDKAKMKASMATIMKDREEALGKVLTPEQMKTYQAQMSKNAKTMKKHMESSSASSSK